MVFSVLQQFHSVYLTLTAMSQVTWKMIKHVVYKTIIGELDEHLIHLDYEYES